MNRTLRTAFLPALVGALMLAPASLMAQSAAAAPADSLAFPRQFVSWIFAGKGDSAYAHSGAKLRESMRSAQNVSEMASRLQTRFGINQGTIGEVQFAEDSLKVYVAAIDFSQAPETAAWIVVYNPATSVVERSAFQPLSAIKAKYPQVKLP